ncbi:MAG TPA: ORF6N domain-containing protein [Nitrospirota bacterium]|nr:ORF6N domain-containing protein [Nitrospirota bacterium]
MKSLVAMEVVEKKIVLIRGQKVILDVDLSELYRVPTKVFNQAVKRNIDRFPKDFMFQLTADEALAIRSQFVTASKRNIRYLPYAFTEHGIIMAASILNSQRAIDASVYVVRAFVKLREMIASHKDLVKKLDELEKKYDGQFQIVFEAIRQILEVEDKPKRKIGFIAKERRVPYRTARKQG